MTCKNSIWPQQTATDRNKHWGPGQVYAMTQSTHVHYINHHEMKTETSCWRESPCHVNLRSRQASHLLTGNAHTTKTQKYQLSSRHHKPRYLVPCANWSMCCTIAIADTIFTEASSVIHIFTSDKLLQSKKLQTNYAKQRSCQMFCAAAAVKPTVRQCSAIF